MEGVGGARLVRADASYLNRVGGVGRATVGEGGSCERDDMVAARENEVTNETFVSVDDEVSSKFFGLFVVLHQFGGRHASEVTSY